MITGVYQSIVVVLILASFYIVDTYSHHKYDRERTNGESGRSWPIIVSSIILAVLFVLQPILWPNLSFYTDAWWGLVIQIMGLGLAFASSILNEWSRRELGVFYVQGSVVQENHKLIDTGPYALVRHPIFSSYFMLVAGLLLCNPSVHMGLLLIGVYFYLNMWTRKDEELLLASVDGYQEYMARSNRYIPSLAALVHWFRRASHTNQEKLKADIGDVS